MNLPPIIDNLAGWLDHAEQVRRHGRQLGQRDARYASVAIRRYVEQLGLRGSVRLRSASNVRRQAAGGAR